MNPYKTLGVEPDAKPEEIKAAFREKAKQHHTDHGGDNEEMALVNLAWAILRDPDRRARYDKFGFDPDAAPTPAEQIIKTLITKTIVDMSRAGAEVNLIRFLQENIDAEIGAIEDGRHKTIVALKELRRLMKRFKGPDHDVIGAHLKMMEEQMEGNLRVTKENITTLKAAFSILGEYEDTGFDQKILDRIKSDSRGRRSPAGFFTSWT